VNRSWRLGLLDQQVLQRDLGAQIVERRLLLLHRCLGAFQGRLERPVVDADDRLASGDMLVVLDEDLIDMSRNAWRERRDIAADIGVVGRHQEAVGLPPFRAVPPGSANRDQRGPEQQGLPALSDGLRNFND
jgi:hypothetical protein